MEITGIQRLFTFPGWVVTRVEFDRTLTRVYLRRDGRCRCGCPACGSRMTVSRKVERVVMDLPMGLCLAVEIHFETIQARCRKCRIYKTFHPEGVEEGSRATVRLMRYVSWLGRYLPLTDIARMVPLSVSTLWRWDKAVLQAAMPEPSLDGLEVLLVDEKHVHNGHGYVTVVLNGRNGEVLHLAEGRKKDSLASFVERLTPEQRKSIRAVGLDRSGAYAKVVREMLPNADIVYDKFHLIMNYGEVLDSLRRRAYRQASEKDRAFIKGTRYALLRNWENTSTEERRSLKTLLEANGELSCAYLLKDSLKVVWSYRYAACGARYLDQWIAWARESGIDLIQRFADGLNRARDGIISYFRHRITNGLIEGFNAHIAGLIRRGCGYRDLEYLFLKIRQLARPHQSLADALTS